MNNDNPPVERIDRNSDVFPKRLEKLLGSQCPDHLDIQGNTSLLYEPGIGFCGSRDVSDKGMNAAYTCAQIALDHTFSIVSGHARGVDRTTHKVALEQGGNTIIVLPEGIEKFRPAKELREHWDWERVLVVSQFVPQAIWRSYQAMQRNLVIIGLSDAMVVVEAGEKGGTRAAGEQSLVMKVPVFAIDYGFDEEMAPGNRYLIGRGAEPLRKSNKTGKPNFNRLFEHAEGFNSLLQESIVHDLSWPISKQHSLL